MAPLLLKEKHKLFHTTLHIRYLCTSYLGSLSSSLHLYLGFAKHLGFFLLLAITCSALPYLDCLVIVLSLQNPHLK